MSEERTGPEPGEPDDLELDEGEEGSVDEGEELDVDEADEEGGEQAPPEPEPPPRSRSRERITRQQRELQDLREQNRRLTEALTRQPAQPQYQPQPDPIRQAQFDQQERDRVAQMPFEEQGRYWADKRAQELNQRVLLSELRTGDMLDQHHFKQIMRERRLPQRYATEVENLLSEARRNNMNPSREDVLYRVIGREFVEKKDRETEKQRQRGQRRIASQTVRPGGRGSTAATAPRRGQNQDAEDEALLRSITWGEANR